MPAIVHNASSERKCQMHYEVLHTEKMMNPAERLRSARQKAGYESAKSAAEAMGVPVATYIQHENGVRGFPATRADRYAKFFRVQPEWLLYGQPPLKTAGPGLGPLLSIKGTVAAGVWTVAQQLGEAEWQTFTGAPDVVAPLRDRYGVRVEGQSMNLIYPPGTILECVRYWGSEPIQSGRRVIVQRLRDSGEYETTVKEYVVDGDGVVWFVPRSSNPAFQAFRFGQHEDGIQSAEIVAIVVASIRYET